MKTIQHTALLVIALSLSACEGGLLGTFSTPAPAVAGENYIDLSGSPVPVGSPLTEQAPSGTYTPPTPPTPTMDVPGVNLSLAPWQLESIPDDSPQFYEDAKAVRLSYQYQDAGWFFEPVPHLNALGYPEFTAECLFSAHASECALRDGEVVDEAYLSAHTPLVRNSDVLREEWACGTICVDETGRVMGRVSAEMIAWRDRHCTWVQYGLPNCN